MSKNQAKKTNQDLLDEFLQEEADIETRTDHVRRMNRAQETKRERRADLDVSDFQVEEIDLERKIQQITLDDPLWEETFKTALKLERNGKEFQFVVLKHEEKTGKTAHCKTYIHDIPLVSDIVSAWGSGRYRLMLKYWDPGKTLKNGKRGGYTLSYRDRSFVNPYGDGDVSVEFSEKKYMESFLTLYSMQEKLLTVQKTLVDQLEVISTTSEKLFARLAKEDA